MMQTMWNVCKVLFVFLICTVLFYYGLRMLHAEFEHYHRYETPDGPAIKVYQPSEDTLLDRVYLFLRLGE